MNITTRRFAFQRPGSPSVLSQPLSAFALSARLGPGEREAIALALEIGNCYLLLDDLAARRAALSLHIRVIGTVGLLLLAKQLGLIVRLRPYLDSLCAQDFHISDHLYERALVRAQEP